MTTSCRGTLPMENAEAAPAPWHDATPPPELPAVGQTGGGPPGLPRTEEREAMLRALAQVVPTPVAGYAWAFRRIHPGALLVTSFVLSQIANEMLIYEVFEAYGTRSTARTLVEIVSPLTLWFLVDTAIQIVLTLLGRGHRILVQTVAGELLVFHRRLFSARPAQLEHRLAGSLAIAPGSLGFAIDRMDTPVGRFYLWARWRDMRILLTPGILAP